VIGESGVANCCFKWLRISLGVLYYYIILDEWSRTFLSNELS
jgi:hypothetical protein